MERNTYITFRVWIAEVCIRPSHIDQNYVYEDESRDTSNVLIF